jgi:hypothetical protein
MKFSSDLAKYFTVAFSVTFCVTLVCIYQIGLYYTGAIHYPPGYAADGLFTMANAKLIADNGTFHGMQTNLLGYPFNSELDAWYPIPEKGLFLIYALLIKFFGLYPASNIILVLGHVLSGLGFVFAGVWLRVKTVLLFSFALVFALTPFIFTRGLAHLTVASVWVVPLLVVLVVKIYTQRELIQDKKFRVIALFVSFVSGTLSPYYSIMYCQFIFGAFVLFTLRKDREARNFCALLGIVVISAVLLCNFQYIQNVIFSSAPSLRNLAALEVYGLKIPELFLPTGHSKIEKFARVANEMYYNKAFVKGEVWSPYLGLVGILCFLYFTFDYIRALAFKVKDSIQGYSTQILWILLFSTVGGVNLLAGTFGFQFLRATNRYSIWILAIVLIYTLQKLSQIKSPIKSYSIALAILFIVWVDLPQKYTLVSKLDIQSKIKGDQNLVSTIEKVLPNPNLLVLPMQRYPENGPVENMSDYDFLRLFLNSNKIQQTYGLVKNDQLNPNLLENFNEKTFNIQIIENIGINGILINRSGYSSENLNSLLSKVDKYYQDRLDIGVEYIFYHKRKKSTNEIKSNNFLIYKNGWYDQEMSWRWASSRKPSLYIYCDPSHTKQLSIKMGIQSYGQQRKVEIHADGRKIWNGEVTGAIEELELPLTCNDNKSILLEMSVSGKPMPAPAGDSRSLTISIHNAQIFNK